MHEFEMWSDGRDWGSSDAHFGSSESGGDGSPGVARFVALDGVARGAAFADVAPPLPAGYDVTKPWFLTVTRAGNEYVYATSLYAPRWSPCKGANSFVRRRTWCRVAHRGGAETNGGGGAVPSDDAGPGRGGDEETTALADDDDNVDDDNGAAEEGGGDGGGGGDGDGGGSDGGGDGDGGGSDEEEKKEAPHDAAPEKP